MFASVLSNIEILHGAAALLPLVSTSAIMPRQADDTIFHFGLIAINSGSPIHLSSVNASDSKFWIDKPTSTFCPAIDGLDCSQFKNFTAFSEASGSDFLGLVRPLFTSFQPITILGVLIQAIP